MAVLRGLKLGDCRDAIVCLEKYVQHNARDDDVDDKIQPAQDATGDSKHTDPGGERRDDQFHEWRERAENADRCAYEVHIQLKVEFHKHVASGPERHDDDFEAR